VSKARLVITAVVVEDRPVGEVAAAYGVHRAWVYKLLARYRVEGEAAFEPRSRRPKSSPTATPDAIVELVVRLRKELVEQGLDAGPHTLVWHLEHHHQTRLSAATVSRILTRTGQVVPDPGKRPKASYRRFQAELPNQMWQTDFTHWRLTGRRGVEILNILDDHSRYLLACAAFARVTGAAVMATFQETMEINGMPATVLSDNGMVFTTRFAGRRDGRGNRNGLETLLAQHGIKKINSSPSHPQTCGKIERFHSTLKQWLTRQPRARTLPDLQAQLDAFREHYNHHRPHRGIGRRPPAIAYTSRPKAAPADYTPPTHDRVRRDRIDTSGKVTLRHNGHLYKIGIGRTHARTPVLLLVQDLKIRVVNEATGELLRELTLNPTKTYQPTGKPKHDRPNP
jgi:transposase InsO family protein